MPDRELVNTGTSKRYVRRDAKGQFGTDQVDVGRSLSKDDQTKAEHTTRKGQGDRGDRSAH
jgi:hypothetical protein